MPEVTTQEFNPNFSTALDIESLISAPLVAVSKANVVMAQGQTRFLLEYCFKKVGDNHEPVMIQMALNRTVLDPGKALKAAVEASPPGVFPIVQAAAEIPAVPPSLQTVTSYFNLPLLTIVPLNSLAVDKVNIDFDLEITSVSSKPSGGTNQSENKITDQKAQLYGKVGAVNNTSNADDRADSNNSRSSSKIKVSINASTLPLPPGVLTIIDLYTKSIQAVATDPKTDNNL